LKEIRESGTHLLNEYGSWQSWQRSTMKTTVTGALRRIINEVPEEEQNALRKKN
jgi:hypothetical protein